MTGDINSFLRPSAGGRGLPASSVGRLFAATDWGATELGPVERWPQALRIAVSICLNSRFPMFVWWGPNLINIYNDAYAPMLGKRHPQAMGRPARASWHDIWDVLTPQVEAVMQRGEATWNERMPLQIERNGFPETAWFTWSYSPVYRDDGAIGGLFCAVSEETARITAEIDRDALAREAQDRARTLRSWFDNAPGFVAVLHGPDLTFEMVNKAYYQLVGQRELVGRKLFDALPDARGQGFEELLERVLATGEPVVGRAQRFVVRRAPDAEPVETFIDFVYQPVTDAGGKVISIFAQGHEVTEQVRAVEGLKEADRRKDVFLATLAHELRNPLAPIRNAVVLAKSAAADAARRQWALDVIERQASHMGMLLNDLLDVSRVSQGRLQLRLQSVDLQRVVDAAVEIVQPLADAKKQRLDVRLPAQPVAFTADPVRVTQVLGNLLSNAAKYTDAGGNLELEACVEQGRLVLVVRDDGIGIQPQMQEQVFTMFAQVPSASDRSEGGLGIGLALTRSLVELHGGSIEVRSDGLGKGSQFIVTLPL